MIVAEILPICQLRRICIAAPLNGSWIPERKRGGGRPWPSCFTRRDIRAQQHRKDLVLGGVQSTPESRLLQMDTACWPDKCYHSPMTHGDENTPALSFFFPEDDSAGSVFPALAALPTRVTPQ